MSVKLTGAEKRTLSAWIDSELSPLVDYDVTPVTEFILVYLEKTAGVLDGEGGARALEKEMAQFGLGKSNATFVRKLLLCLSERRYAPAAGEGSAYRKRSRSSERDERRGRSRSRSRSRDHRREHSRSRSRSPRGGRGGGGGGGGVGGGAGGLRGGAVPAAAG